MRQRPNGIKPGQQFWDCSVYYCLVNGAIAVLILHRRSLLAGPQPTSSPARTFP